MADIEGDKSKRPTTCMTETMPTACPHIRDVTPRSMDKETWQCDLCGQRFTLHYEDMA